MFETLIQGLLLGGLYALFALGLSIMFGVMRLTNIAQGDFIVLAAFVAVALAAQLGSGIGLTLLLLLPAGFLIGHQLQTHLLNRTMGKDPLPSLVVTFGLSIVIQNALQEVFSADPRSLDSGGLNTASFALGDMSIGVLPLLIFAAAVACTVGLQWLFARTALGRSFRAVSDDPEIAELMGLKSWRVYAMATGIAFALIALAGWFQVLRTTVAPTDGPMLLLFAFEAVIIGGMGSFWGTFIGAMVLGLTQQIGFTIDPGWGLWLGHMVFLAVLVVRPQGLFPKTRG
ncbi:branched-chain amino acid ABC transporter permease [Hydrogenophaga sp. D2P1]|uniref:Branched-chain amino acid ABC transporter permease n=1 Tax=Hydrogenophaga aromaticivorans TaxID=2610898 RepID=A0A7Y8GY51_9BURK|nr:branched-chain amino acid ABC transporter permease [Hydrogenophaga aromaticivorans]NWF47035.1 branched-chain amino acid ABC transporter permease [Hydrogenophaga aromaticivorans]